MSILLKLVSAMEKCFMDEPFSSKKEKTRSSALLGEEVCFEAAYTSDDPAESPKAWLTLSVSSPLAEFVRVRQVEQIPVRYPAYPSSDDYFLRKTPGLYPDLLRDLAPGNTVFATYGELKALFVTVKIPENLSGGDYPVTLTLKRGEETAAEATYTVHVIEKVLPKQKMIVTEWFHTDCIANYYNLETFSEQHWDHIEKFMRTAVENGINTILTPVFTPPLDTAVGGERRTVQLVDVYRENGEYAFGFDKLERWVETAQRAGVEYFEVSHLYTQWGAAHAPKIMAYDNGEYRRIFGWETDAFSEEYKTFLRTFLTAFVAEMKRLGVDKQCLYHISDEPSLGHLENYKRAKAQINDIIADYVIMDALSDFEFYKTGALENPIPANNHIEPFIEAGVKNLWTYYCCGQTYKVSNRMVAMPSQRTRVIGAQFWKYNIAGFLQWGYNFYNDQGSTRSINPFAVTDGDYFVPAGDCFAVYPGENGVPMETLHMKAFTMALYDRRAMDLAEELAGREAVLALVESRGEVTFSDYPHDEDYVDELREAVNELIERM